MIQLSSVTKLYGTVIGVNDITLELAPGAYGLLGPNGSGKTTLLSLLTGQLIPSIGSVRVLGRAPRNNPDLCRRVGYCPDSDGLYSSVSGFDWVHYLLRLHGMTSADATAATENAIDVVGMRPAMHRPIANYSRGMRQRIKLAQAIAHDPEFLILDEPFNGLDPIARHEMTTLLRDWIARGRSLLLASHLLHEVEAVTRSFLLICGGRLLASGTAAEARQMLANLPNEFVLVTNAPHRLAALLAERQIADSLRIDGPSVTVATRRPAELAKQLPLWLTEARIEVSEMRSTDESLQGLFDSLMKIHRGEIG